MSKIESYNNEFKFYIKDLKEYFAINDKYDYCMTILHSKKYLENIKVNAEEVINYISNLLSDLDNLKKSLNITDDSFDNPFSMPIGSVVEYNGMKCGIVNKTKNSISIVPLHEVSYGSYKHAKDFCKNYDGPCEIMGYHAKAIKCELPSSQELTTSRVVFSLDPGKYWTSETYFDGRNNVLFKFDLSSTIAAEDVAKMPDKDHYYDIIIKITLYR